MMQVIKNINFDVIFYSPSFPCYSVTTRFMFLEFVKDEATATEAKLKLHPFPASIISSAAMEKKPKLLHWTFLLIFFCFMFF